MNWILTYKERITILKFVVSFNLFFHWNYILCHGCCIIEKLKRLDFFYHFRNVFSQGKLGIVEKEGPNDLQTQADRSAQVLKFFIGNLDGLNWLVGYSTWMSHLILSRIASLHRSSHNIQIWKLLVRRENWTWALLRKSVSTNINREILH